MNKNGTFNIKYNSQEYNIWQFMNNHPGGVNYVETYKEKDVTKSMETYNHSKAALYLLQEYRKEEKNKNKEEDLEKYVDWNKPMFSQVTRLGTEYYQWVTSPVDRHLQLFGNPILEFLTITPWYLVPLLWIPISFYFLIAGIEKYAHITKDPTPLLPAAMIFLGGVILWTLIEYTLHRFVFHIEPSGHSKAMVYFHFAIHGLHHKVPFDSMRLVFPPVPAAIITYTLYKTISLILPESSILLVLAGGIVGYVTYDMIHFYLHHGAPTENSYFYHLKRYHNQHHFAHQNNGFGISSTLWDKVFGTALQLRSLHKAIKW